jgi:hypothetical protein
MPRTYAILISFRFGTQRWENVPFLRAIDTIEKFLDAEQNALITLETQFNTDQWIAAYWSEVLGRATPPKDLDFSAARLALGRARNTYNAGRDQDSRHALGQSVHAFNLVHQKFWAYRAALSTGGERAITTMQITNMVLGAAFSAGVGVMGASVSGGAAATAGLTLAQQTAFNAMMVHIGAQQRFDIADIVLQTGASFVSSLLSGKLCEKFATAIARRYFATAAQRAAVVKLYTPPGFAQMNFAQIADWAERARVALPFARQMTSPQEFLSGLLASFGADRLLDVVTRVAKENKGKLLMVTDLMEQIAEHVLKQLSWGKTGGTLASKE